MCREEAEPLVFGTVKEVGVDAGLVFGLIVFPGLCEVNRRRASSAAGRTKHATYL